MMHTTTGRWKLGLGLALVTSLLWGILPIALKLLLDHMDVYSITWYRFFVAAVLLGAFQAKRRTLPALGSIDRKSWLLLAVAVVGLMANYNLYLIGLDYITPAAAQIVIQLAPMLLLLGGLIVFGERFGWVQWLGFASLLAGLALFFNHRLDELFAHLGDYLTGLLFIAVSAFVWAAYALAQKQLLKDLASEQILLLIYVAGVAAFWPAAEPASLWQMDSFALALLAFVSFNTLVAYGCFAEALDHWEASRVSAVLAITPLVTLASMAMFSRFSNAITPEPLNSLSLLGGALVVAGSVMMSLTTKPKGASN